jgi:hypothetical protein
MAKFQIPLALLTLLSALSLTTEAKKSAVNKPALSQVNAKDAALYWTYSMAVLEGLQVDDYAANASHCYT